MIEPSGTAGEHLRAFLRVGGISIARHQLGLALALGCERIICVASGLDPELVALQHVAEENRANFHRVSGAHGLLGLVTATDEVIALEDGLLANPDMAIAQLDAGLCVLVQPIETGLVAGFERIDINHAAGGAMRVPGRLIERLSEMPVDCGVFSTLQRVALQAGVPQRSLPPEAHESGRWSLVRNEDEAHATEGPWIRLHTATEGSSTPSTLIARRAVRALGPALLHAGSSGAVVAAAATLAVLLGLVLGWFGLATTGLGCCALAWVLFRSASLFGRVERSSLRLPHPRLAPAGVYAGIMDASLVLLLIWNEPALVGSGFVRRIFAPVMLLGLARFVPCVTRSAWTSWLEDRAVLALILAVASALGWLAGTVEVMAVAMLIAGIAFVHHRNRLTPA